MQRVHNSLFSGLERSALIWMARRMPPFIMPDHVTAFGIFGGMVTLLGYVLSWWATEFLWLASLGLVLHWLGDSLDGTLARVRGTERPKYGYFLDQTVDVIGNLLIVVGMGLSPFVRMDVALLALAGYHALSIYSYVRTCISHEFHVSLLGSGPTEIRMLIIGMNSFVLMFGAPHFSVLGILLTWCDVALLMMATIFMTAFVYLVAGYAVTLREADRSDHALPAMAGEAATDQP